MNLSKFYRLPPNLPPEDLPPPDEGELIRGTGEDDLGVILLLGVLGRGVIDLLGVDGRDPFPNPSLLEGLVGLASGL